VAVFTEVTAQFIDGARSLLVVHPDFGARVAAAQFVADANRRQHESKLGRCRVCEIEREGTCGQDALRQ